jgi:hypothetical protein
VRFLQLNLEEIWGEKNVISFWSLIILKNVSKMTFFLGFWPKCDFCVPGTSYPEVYCCFWSG